MFPARLRDGLYLFGISLGIQDTFHCEKDYNDETAQAETPVHPRQRLHHPAPTYQSLPLLSAYVFPCCANPTQQLYSTVTQIQQLPMMPQPVYRLLIGISRLILLS